MAEQIINSDGKTYSFKSGKDGSLTVISPRRALPDFLAPRPRAKVIPAAPVPAPATEAPKKPLIIASSRG